MRIHYSPLRYPGGKAKLADFIYDLLKVKKDAKKTVFVEPFGGGAGAALTLLLTSKVSKIIINDLDPAIYSFWKTVVNDTEKLITKIRKTEISTKEWRKQRAIYDNKQSDEFELGFATFYLNRTNRSGIIEGGPIGGFEQSGEWKIDVRFNKEPLIDRIQKIAEFKNKIRVTNLDGIKLLESLEKKKNFEDYYIFLDPPYIKKGQFLYLNHYQKNNHEDLANFLETSRLDWVMTYDDTRYVRDLYNTMQIKGFTIPHTAYVRKVGKEVLISPTVIKGRVRV